MATQAFKGIDLDITHYDTDELLAMFNLTDPTEDDNLEIPSGRGIMLMKAYMSEVEYRDPGNHLAMVYRKSKGA